MRKPTSVLAAAPVFAMGIDLALEQLKGGPCAALKRDERVKQAYLGRK